MSNQRRCCRARRRSSGVGGGHGGAGGCLLLLRSSMQSRPFLPLPSALPCVPARRLSLSLTPPPRRCRSPPALHVLAHSTPIPSRPVPLVAFLLSLVVRSIRFARHDHEYPPRDSSSAPTRRMHGSDALACLSFVRSSMPRARSSWFG
jgi:hypothetical protein